MTSIDAQLEMLTAYQLAARQILAGADAPKVVAALVNSQTQTISAALESGNAQQIKSAIEKRDAELQKLARSFDVLGYCADIPAALAATRKLVLLWHSVASTDIVAHELVKQSYKALFRSKTAIALDNVAASTFFAFVADVLVASEAGAVTSNVALRIASDVELRSIGAYINATAGALNTHESKSAHSSAQLQAVCSSAETSSPYFNSQAFPVLVSARAGGGPLRMASWLENMYCVRVSVAGRTFMVYDAICDSSTRSFLAAQGVTALDNVALGKPSTGRFNAQLVGQVRIKTAEGSVALHLVPSNAMLEMTAALGERIAAKTALRVAQSYREAVLAHLPENSRDVIAKSYPVEAFIPAAERSFNIEKLVKSIKSTLKAEKLPGSVDQAVLNSVWRQPELNRLRQGRHLLRVPIVGSNAQNCGGAYLQFAGGKGLYRFPAMKQLPRKGAPREERNFYSADTILTTAISNAIKGCVSQPTLEEKYQIDDKWLPRRMQQYLQQKHITAAAAAYVAIVNQIKKSVRLTDEQIELLSTPGNSPYQAYLLQGQSAPPEQLLKLAQRGRGLLKASDAASHAMFDVAVVNILQGKA